MWNANVHFTCRGQEIKTKMKAMKEDWYKKIWPVDMEDILWN